MLNCYTSIWQLLGQFQNMQLQCGITRLINKSQTNKIEAIQMKKALGETQTLRAGCSKA